MSGSSGSSARGALVRHEMRVLRIAEWVPEVASFVSYVRGDFRAFWSEVLGLELKEETFAALCITAWARQSVERITLDTVALTAIIEEAAGLRNTFAETVALRARVDAINVRLIDEARAVRARKAIACAAL